MGLIAREIEAAGIPTLSMTSALSITQSVGPPRAAFLDYPLGHTTGKPHDPALQRAILVEALQAFGTLDAPGVVELPFRWAGDDSWKEGVMRPRAAGGEGASAEDDRTARHDTPQYQDERDRALAEQALAAGGCAGCVFLDDPKRA